MDASIKPYLRLRQICLVAPTLEPAVEAIKKIFGIPECHRDKGVEKYGLENALFAFGNSFVEIVAPLRDGTAAGRFLQRSGGNDGYGGYMAIFDCNDPERRKERALAMGVRVAHEMDYPGFRGTQLHPADCRATMLEFDHTSSGEAVDGSYYPAGPHWQETRRLDRVAGIESIEVESPNPSGIAGHWSKLMDVPLEEDAGAPGTPTLRFDLGAVRFIKAQAGSPERLSAINVRVPDVARVMEAAKAAGYAAGSPTNDATNDAGFHLYGVRFRPVQAAA